MDTTKLIDRLEGLKGLLEFAGLNPAVQDLTDLPQERTEQECIEAVGEAIARLRAAG